MYTCIAIAAVTGVALVSPYLSHMASSTASALRYAYESSFNTTIYHGNNFCTTYEGPLSVNHACDSPTPDRIHQLLTETNNLYRGEGNLLNNGPLKKFLETFESLPSSTFAEIPSDILEANILGQMSLTIDSQKAFQENSQVFSDSFSLFLSEIMAKNVNLRKINLNGFPFLKDGQLVDMKYVKNNPGDEPQNILFLPYVVKNHLERGNICSDENHAFTEAVKKLTPLGLSFLVLGKDLTKPLYFKPVAFERADRTGGRGYIITNTPQEEGSSMFSINIHEESPQKYDGTY